MRYEKIAQPTSGRCRAIRGLRTERFSTLSVLLTTAARGLPSDSVAVPLRLELIDRDWLGDRVGQLPLPLVRAIDDGIRAVLGL